MVLSIITYWVGRIYLQINLEVNFFAKEGFFRASTTDSASSLSPLFWMTADCLFLTCLRFRLNIAFAKLTAVLTDLLEWVLVRFLISLYLIVRLWTWLLCMRMTSMGCFSIGFVLIFVVLFSFCLMYRHLPKKKKKKNFFRLI